MLMVYHWLLKEEYRCQHQVITHLEARRKAVDESSLRRAQLSSKGNDHIVAKRCSRLDHLTDKEREEAPRFLDFSSMMVDTRGNVLLKTP